MMTLIINIPRKVTLIIVTHDIMTGGISTFGITKFSITTLNVATLGRTTFNMIPFRRTVKSVVLFITLMLRKCYNLAIILSVIMLNVLVPSIYISATLGYTLLCFSTTLAVFCKINNIGMIFWEKAQT
jgi:hypothetical protein